MKKGLLAVLMAVALIVPAFAAEKGSMEIVGKIGLNLNPNVAASGELAKNGGFKPGDYGDCDCDVNKSVLIGAEFFYYLKKNFALGFGINNNFDADLQDLRDGELKVNSKIGFTNFYFAVKPKIELKSEAFKSIYFLGQLGYGLLRFDSTYKIRDNNEEKLAGADGNGLYWGIGVGTELRESFIVELLYSVNYGSIKDKFVTGREADLTYKTLTLNIGYKFNF